MKQKLFTLLTLALFFCSGAWAQDFTYALSSFTVTNTTYTYEFSENKLQNKTAWVEVPSSNSEGTITFKCSGNKNDRFLYIYGTNGTVKDETRKIVMNTSWPTAIAFSSSDIKTSGGKYYLVFGTSDDFKANGVKYTLTDPSGLEITPASGYYAGKASVTMSANDGYTIYYTDNGTAPSKSSTVYTGSFDVTSNKTIKAIAYKGEDYGFVHTAEYTIVPENRTYLADPTAADFTALRGNTTNFEDDTANGYIKNKVQFNANTDYALEGSDGTDISVAQGLLIRSTNNFSVGDFRYYYKDDDYKFYSNKSNTSYKIPAVKAGQKVIFEMSAGGGRTITGTNTDEASQSYTSGTVKLTFTATADGTVTLKNSGSGYVYSIEVKTPVYYTVEYDLNGGTGTTPTETDKEEGDKFNLHNGTTGITAPSGKVFDGWNDGTSTYAGGEEYTMPGDDVTLTAQWADFVVKHTITYAANGGSGSMANTLVVDGEDQALPANTFTRECYNFTGWVADVDVTIGGAGVTAGTIIDDESTIQNVTSDITLTAQWSKVYASGSYTFENNATVGTSPGKTVKTSKTTYDAFQVDNLYFSGMAIEYEAGVYGGEGDDFKGWKIKTKDATIKFFVESDKSVIIGVGNLSSGAKISYTNTAGEEKNDIALTAKTNNTYDVKGGTMVTVKTDGASTVTLKKIYITNATSTISATVGKNGYTTFASPYALDLTDANRPDGLKAYKATRDGVNISFTALNQTVAPGTGLLLLGETKDGSYDIKVVDSGDAIYGNALIGVTSVTPKQSVADDTYYFVMKKATDAESALEFLPLSTSTVNIPAGKAYIEVPNSAFPSGGGAQELSFTFEDEAGDVTGIAEVSSKKQNNGEYYNLNGQRVDASHKGIVIVNGKKFFNK